MAKLKKTYIGNISATASGSAYFKCDELKTFDNKDFFIHKENLNKAFHQDTVKVKIISDFEVEVIQIIERFKTEFIGTVNYYNGYYFVPDNSKLTIDFNIPDSKLNNAKENQKVIVKLTDWNNNETNPNCEVLKILGNVGDNDAEIHGILAEYSLPYVFNNEVLTESNLIPTTISDDEISQRRDMRNIFTCTIDGDDSKDFDDALSLNWNDGVCEIGVHIADVTHYVKPNSLLDDEAFKRGNSVYLVDRCVPMLPERLSNGICSLNPNEDRLCVSVIFTLDKDGNVTSEWFGRTVINSNYRLTYDGVQDIIERKPNENYNKELRESIAIFDKWAKKWRKQRLDGGSMNFDKSEIKFKLDDNKKPIAVILKETKDSNHLIEEFMLLANKSVARFIESKGYPCINRIHDSPNMEKLDELKSFVKGFGYNLDLSDEKEIRKSLNKLLRKSKDGAESDIISNLVIRSQSKAEYSIRSIGHWGLGDEFGSYCHFTSPIRRYSDMMVHEILIKVLNNEKLSENLGQLTTKCSWISATESKAQKAERASIKYMQTVFMKGMVGKIFKGVISSITDFGIFVTINEFHSECFVKISKYSNDWVIDMKKWKIKSVEGGVEYKLGGKITIKLKKVEVDKKQIDAEIVF
jgi:ribonuclease R